MSECIFCNCNNSEIIAENRWTFAILDYFLVNEGIPLRDIFLISLR